jgi:hypothetical protein
MVVSLLIEVPDTWFSMLVRLSTEMEARGKASTPERVASALVRLGLRMAGGEACALAAAKLDLSSLTEAELGQLDSALVKLMLHGARGLS